ncbi:MAG TPA: hypothetical protein VIM48_02480 [Chthoniobacterales bacterium]
MRQGFSIVKTSLILLLGGLLFSGPVRASEPSPLRRFGFQGFSAHYVGGYSVTSASSTTGSLAGPATIRIIAPANGRSARVIWSNTFYTEKGSYRVTLRWIFAANGSVTANTIDPRKAGAVGSGTFVLNGNQAVRFTAEAIGQPGVIATGKLKLIGGGALGITVTLTGLPEGDVTYGFSGSRVN